MDIRFFKLGFKSLIATLLLCGTALSSVQVNVISVSGSGIISGNIILSLSIGPDTNTPAATNIWAQRFGSTGSDGGYAVKVDSSSNILASGWYTGNVSFGTNWLTGFGGQDLFLLKMNPSGTLLWAKGYGGSGSETPLTIATDPSGNIFVGGYFSGTANLGGSNLVSIGNLDMFLAKYDSSGNHVWSESFGTTNADQLSSIAVDNGGNIWATGYFQGLINFGTTNIVSVNNSVDTFLAKFNNNGTVIFGRNFPNSSYDAGTGIALDSNTNVYLAGYFKFNLNLGGGVMNTPSGNEVFLGKFNSSGVYQWQQKYGANTARCWSLAVDSSGNIAIAGDFTGTTDMGSGTITGTGIDNDMFVAKYLGSNGSNVWVNPIYCNLGGLPYQVATDANNNVVATGYYYGTSNFGSKSFSSVNGSYDIWVSKYSSSGTPSNAQSFGGTGTDIGQSLYIGADGYCALAGTFQQTGTFAGGQSLTSSVGSYDILIQRFLP